jgi:hypothetical protein
MDRRSCSLFTAGLALALAGCHAEVDVAPTGDAGPSDAPVALQDGSPCPVAVPSAQASCPSEVACEYGGDAHGACRTVATCGGSAGAMKWTVAPPAEGCAAPVNPAACPAAYLTLHPASACPIAGGKLSCDYTEGRCACIPCTDEGGLSAEWGCRPWDGAIALGSYAPDASASCPADLPELGAPCDYPDQTLCQYAAQCVGVSLGHSVACADGYWQPATPPPANCVGLTCG